MGELADSEYAKLDVIIADRGGDWLRMQVITRIADGESPRDIARSFGVHYVYLKRWLEDNAAEDMALAKRAHSDMLVSKSLDEVENACIEDVAVARLRAETYLKIAGKQDKAAWGDGSQISGGGGSITIVIGDVVRDEKVVGGDVI